jgi:hypothetical protein
MHVLYDRTTGNLLERLGNSLTAGFPIPCFGVLCAKIKEAIFIGFLVTK